MYRPRIERIEAGMRTPALLFGGDGQRRAWATRASVAGRQHVSRSPRPLTGATAAAMAEGSSAGIAQDRAGELERRFRFKRTLPTVGTRRHSQGARWMQEKFLVKLVY